MFRSGERSEMGTFSSEIVQERGIFRSENVHEWEMFWSWKYPRNVQEWGMFRNRE